MNFVSRPSRNRERETDTRSLVLTGFYMFFLLIVGYILHSMAIVSVEVVMMGGVLLLVYYWRAQLAKLLNPRLNKEHKNKAQEFGADMLKVFKMMKRDFESTDQGLVLVVAVSLFALLLYLWGIVNVHVATLVSALAYGLYVLLAVMYYLVDAVKNIKSGNHCLVLEMVGIPAPVMIGVLVLFALASMYLLK